MFDPGRMDMILRLRSHAIADTNVLRAMESVARKYFTPDAFWDKAYEDRALPIACGQTMLAPLHVAMMAQLLDVKAEHKVLEIGTGTGYMSAILAQLCKRVYTIERYHQLLNHAQTAFGRADITNIVSRHGDGRYGWKGQAPFDRIVITCELKTVPKALVKQLGDTGIMVAVIKGQLSHIEIEDTKTKVRHIYPLSLPPIETGKSQIL